MCTRQVFSLLLRLITSGARLSERSQSTLRQRRYDDLIKAYYEGLTVLIKDLGSEPPGASFSSQNSCMEACLENCSINLEQLI